MRHEENSNGEKMVGRKSDREEFGEVRHGEKRAKPMKDEPSMKGSLYP
jgi:hypothetical protein